ncbi:hypothetical protein HF673_02680 [Acidithiobacillus thiooxidans]|uniref:hypothetical protein n=1 Tax=Acidithiobacillus thiooxidans TaxID=930 RepID=UPI001C07CA79|nr:hypothetical protein [Acidithiobacillus thiooxidans]MBU2834713.1 hypothetical protein [Acidithiobacillus thiooxidans]
MYVSLFLLIANIYLAFFFTERMAYYRFGGELPFFLRVGGWILFFWTNWFYVPLAVILRILLGVRLFPVFISKWD